MNTIQFKLIYLLLILVGFSACKKDDDQAAPEVTKTLEVKTASDVAASPIEIDPATGGPKPSTGNFALYCLRENKLINNADSASTNWDIGFRGTTIIINGGAIRSGKGGAYIHDGLFAELQEISEEQAFKVDNSPTDLAITPGSGNGWYNYDQNIHVISPIPGKIIVIRTAKGNYAKLEILNYYKGAPSDLSTVDRAKDARYYTFRYVIQEDGSKKF